MAERKWTPAQTQSFSVHDRSLLIAAAAGSGKTAVLVERVIRMITDPVNPVDVDRLLIVTFTRAAAAQMRQRLSDALAEKMAEEPDNTLYARQQMLLPRAYISTIHGFCARFLREFSGHTDLPIGFKVAEEGQTKLLEEEALELVLEQHYREKDPAFLALAEQLCGNKNDQGLRDTVLGTYQFMQAQPFPEKWLQQQIDAYTAVIPLEKTQWMAPIIRKVDQALERLCHYAEQACIVAKESNIPPYLETEMIDLSTYRNLRDALPTLTYDRLQQELAVLWQNDLARVSKPDAVQKAGMEQVKAYRARIKSRVSKLRELLPRTEAECRQDLARMAPLAEALGRLVQAYTKQFTALKRQHKWLDYNDLEHETLRLLVDSATGQPTLLARDLSKRFVEIMVDEYQDTNAAQDKLFSALSQNEKNLFMVGDVKQSIYGFRQAMPEIFTARRDNYGGYDPEDSVDRPATIQLENNFRSRFQVTDGINFLFGQLMGRRTGGVDYQKEQLVCSAKYPEVDSKTEWMLLNKEDATDITDVQAEARQMARRIRQLMEEMTVTEGEGQRPLEYSDICILTRRRKEMSTFVKEFTALGIPATADNDEDFLKTPEVGVAVSLLRVIDNPLREVSLTAVMLSPLYGFTPDDLAQVRVTVGKYISLYPALEQVLREGTLPHLTERIATLLGDLRRYRTLAVTLPADRLLELVYRDTGMQAVYSARSGGSRRVANLQQLDAIARGFEQGEYRGLSAFVRYIDRIEDSGKSIASGSAVLQEGVRLMTVHGSKGLEFPVVFVARLCGQRNHADSSAKVLLHATAGIGMKLVDRQENEKVTPLPHMGVRLARQLDEMEEELRVWYVALTRAREKLILVYSGSKMDKLFEKIEMELTTEQLLLPDTVLSAPSAGELLLTAAMRHPDFLPLRGPHRVDSLQAKSQWQVAVCPPIGEMASEEEQKATLSADPTLAETLTQRLEYAYPYQSLVGVPAKLAASQLSHRQMNRQHIAVSRPAFLQAEGLTPAQKGTAAHTFMQFADYEKACTNLAEEIDRMVELGFLTRQQADSLDTDRLSAFFKGDLYKRMLTSDHLWREYHFAVSVPAGSLTDLPENTAEEEVLVQGIADCVFREGDALVLVDYKTDRVKDGAELCDRYRTQMEFYKTALETILGLPVKEAVLYSFALGQTVEVTA